MSETNEQVLRHMLALWATRDAKGMADCFAEDGVYDNVPEKKPMLGRAAIRFGEIAPRRSTVLVSKVLVTVSIPADAISIGFTSVVPIPMWSWPAMAFTLLCAASFIPMKNWPLRASTPGAA